MHIVLYLNITLLLISLTFCRLGEKVRELKFESCLSDLEHLFLNTTSDRVFFN